MFKQLVSGMNVAAIIVGHYGEPDCPDRNIAPLQKDHGHCDRANTIDDVRFDWYNGWIPHPNVHGVTPPVINVNAMFHNIFWSVELRPNTNEIAFTRFDRGQMNDYIAKLEELVVEFKALVVVLSACAPGAFNFPVSAGGPPDAYVCNYSVGSAFDDAVCTVKPY